jgi:hypothetical protein
MGAQGRDEAGVVAEQAEPEDHAKKERKSTNKLIMIEAQILK